jgi:NADPH:quinone reductase-like Zn-dependent oxidoreductase
LPQRNEAIDRECNGKKFSGVRTMKAVIINKFGGNDVVEIQDLPRPAPRPEEVLIKVHTASINPVDWKIRSGMLKIFTGSRFPMMLGRECAGEVIGTGKEVKNYKQGDQVIAVPGIRRMGTFAEYSCAPETTVFLKPKNIGFEEAASIPIAGLTALQALRDKGHIALGWKVLINGASGGVGHVAVQIAKIFGAEVTAVCSGANAGFVKSLGVDHVIDYFQEDFTGGDARYDIIFDTVAKCSFGECKKILSSKGVYVSTLPSLSVILSQYITGFLTAKKAKFINVSPDSSDMEWMQTQIEAGRINIVIDKIYSLDQAKEALAYSETGKAKGKIVLKVI